jgi:hypothetical protein
MSNAGLAAQSGLGIGSSNGTIFTHQGNTVSAQQYNQAMNQAIQGSTSKRMHLHVDIEQVGNGYIVGFAGNYGQFIDKQVAVSIEQVQQLITSEMASRMLEGKK